MKVRIDTKTSIATIAPIGRFDFNSHREFRSAYERALASPDISVIHVDLRDVNYLDSSALGMLLLLKDKAASTGHTIAIINSQEPVRQILDMANFGKLFNII